MPDDRWRECLRQGEVRDYWDGDEPVETWSESDWDSVSAVARASRAATRGAATTFDPVTLVYGTRAYQYARGFGGLGHYRIRDGAIDRTADVRIARRDGAAPLVRLGYVHVDRNSVDGDLRSFLKAYDHRKGDVSHFPVSNAGGDAIGEPSTASTSEAL